jgi:hypothetical protein
MTLGAKLTTANDAPHFGIANSLGIIYYRRSIFMIQATGQFRITFFYLRHTLRMIVR